MPETQAAGRPAPSGPDILTRIVATKRVELETLRPRRGVLEAAAEEAPEPRDFEAALRGEGAVSIMAEVKRRSPGAGPIRPELDPVTLAGAYAAGGAAAVSVLTDRDYFGGSLEDLSAVRAAVPLPVLRKDFTLEEVQVVEARAAGADAVLLIVRLLDDAALVRLREAAEALGMAALVEVHDREELRRAAGSGARVVGINNRDLSTFTTRVALTLELLDDAPPGAVIVSESGIRTAADVALLGNGGVNAVLVGESLLRQDDPGEGVRALAGHPRRARHRD